MDEKLKMRAAVIVSDATHMMHTGAPLQQRVRVFDLPDDMAQFIKGNESAYVTFTIALEDEPSTDRRTPEKAE